MMTSSARSHDFAQTANVTLVLFVLQCPSDRSTCLSRFFTRISTSRLTRLTIWLFNAFFSVQSGHLSSESFIHVSMKHLKRYDDDDDG